MNSEVTIVVPQPHKLNPLCPFDTIFITGIVSLIFVSFFLFIFLQLIKKLFHSKISQKRLFLYSVLIVAVFSIISHFFLGIQPVYLPFPFWLTPIDCVYR